MGKILKLAYSIPVTPKLFVSPSGGGDEPVYVPIRAQRAAYPAQSKYVKCPKEQGVCYPQSLAPHRTSMLVVKTGFLEYTGLCLRVISNTTLILLLWVKLK